MSYKEIIIKGAREHNLKNININIPKDKLVVITGLSGSGKSTLAFDTIYAEGQRRYVESLSSYARQFLGIMDKPDVDSIEGLSPAISIEQKTTSNNPRSTVGTVTEIYDYLRLLFARIGTAYCPDHNIEIKSYSPDKISENILNDFKDKEIIILSPIISKKKGTYEKLFQDINKDGFSKIRVNNIIYRTDEPIKLDRYKMHDIDIVIDKINLKNNINIYELIFLALEKSKGFVKIVDNNGFEKIYSSKHSCPICGFSIPDLQPRMFSFNSPFGACKDCSGLGFKMDFDPDLIIPDKNLSIADGAIKVYKNLVDGWRGAHIASISKHYGFDAFTPIKDLTEEQYNILMYGSNEKINYNIKMNNGNTEYKHTGIWEGLLPQITRLYTQTESDYRKRDMEKFMKISPCNTCKGNRLNNIALSVKIANKNIIDITNYSIIECLNFFKHLTLDDSKKEIAVHILKEIISRLDFLEKVGLSYLTLSRTAGTLSGGEAQRIRLATNLGTNLTGVLYVLDEPSIGLHQKDNQKLIDTLINLKNLGNTLIVVEHDEDTIRKADFIIDIGPGAGINGGEIIAKGSVKDIENCKNSLTGKYLKGIEFISIPKNIRIPENFIEIRKASENNLKNINVKIPVGVLTSITGVSGSGKSTLINQILYRYLMNKFYKSRLNVGKCEEIIINNYIDKVISIDQSPIGKTPRSNPATYTKVFDEIRDVFSRTEESKIRGYKSGRFSFNVKGGRCEACQGDGLVKIEMNFLPDVYVTCQECKGKRYNKDTLEIKYKNKNISDVLNMSVLEAYDFFENIPKIKKKLKTLIDVGLSYIKLGQSSTTLSGGEAQRIKITRELSKISTGKTLYILDEPTTGLHFHDVKKLIEVLNKLVDKKNTVVVIEHNLDVIKSSDWVIDLGPDGGAFGGGIIAQGSPREISKIKKSYTGSFLKKYFV
ncbi:MAG: excinuclease ABC subunit UvrA [Candidatus ainarchaeum sp.]|nr:excinuclease ABC subunit UvrA [Candidatus ainarchaeum sp.]MDD3975576.1 excinuclease ABC subunit UvrA [Candidatus ainarchaeum sp.]